MMALPHDPANPARIAPLTGRERKKQERHERVLALRQKQSLTAQEQRFLTIVDRQEDARMRSRDLLKFQEARRMRDDALDQLNTSRTPEIAYASVTESLHQRALSPHELEILDCLTRVSGRSAEEELADAAAPRPSHGHDRLVLDESGAPRLKEMFILHADRIFYRALRRFKERAGTSLKVARRYEVVMRVVENQEPIKDVAKEMGVSLAHAYNYKSDGLAYLAGYVDSEADQEARMPHGE